MEIALKEDSNIVKANHGKTIKLEITYKYQNLDWHGNRVSANLNTR